MKIGQVISISEIVQVIEHLNREVCATAEANYDEGSGCLVIELDSFVRPIDLLHAEQRLRPAWLPTSETIRERMDISEAGSAAKEIFRRWVSRVRSSRPQVKGTYDTKIHS